MQNRPPYVKNNGVLSSYLHSDRGHTRIMTLYIAWPLLGAVTVFTFSGQLVFLIHFKLNIIWYMDFYIHL